MTGSAWRMTNAVESWTWPGCEGQKATVEVYSDAEFVALYCNDKPVGKKRTKKFRAIFKLPYRPGTLKAVALDKSGIALGETTLQTAGQKTRLHLSPEKTTLRADGQSLCFIPITLTDAAGIWKPCANAKVHLKIEVRLPYRPSAVLQHRRMKPTSQQPHHMARTRFGCHSCRNRAGQGARHGHGRRVRAAICGFDGGVKKAGFNAKIVRFNNRIQTRTAGFGRAM